MKFIIRSFRVFERLTLKTGPLDESVRRRRRQRAPGQHDGSRGAFAHRVQLARARCLRGRLPGRAPIPRGAAAHAAPLASAARESLARRHASARCDERVARNARAQQRRIAVLVRGGGIADQLRAAVVRQAAADEERVQTVQPLQTSALLLGSMPAGALEGRAQSSMQRVERKRFVIAAQKITIFDSTAVRHVT